MQDNPGKTAHEAEKMRAEETGTDTGLSAVDGRTGDWRANLMFVGFAALVYFLTFQALEISAASSHNVSALMQSIHHLIAALVVTLSWLVLRAHRKAKQSRRALKAERVQTQHMQALLKAHKQGLDTHAIISVADPAGVIVHVNDRFCEISQYSREELVGQTHDLLNSGYHPKGFFGQMFKAIAAGEPWSEEVCNRAKDGSLFWVAMTIIPVRDAKDHLIEILSILTDITAIKQKSRELRKSNEILHTTFDNYPGGISA